MRCAHLHSPYFLLTKYFENKSGTKAFINSSKNTINIQIVPFAVFSAQNTLTSMRIVLITLLVASVVNGMNSTQTYYRRNELRATRHLKSSSHTSKSMKSNKSSKSSLKEWMVKSPKSGKSTESIKSMKSSKSFKSCKSFKSSKSSKSVKSLKRHDNCSESPSLKPSIYLSNSNEPSTHPITLYPITPYPITSYNPSSSPTRECSMVGKREEAIISIARSYSDDITGDAAVENAIDFLLGDSFIKNGCDERAIRERYALSVLYYSTNGGNWSDNSKWLTEDDHCNWYGLQCSDGGMSKIILSNNKLNGTLPKELRALDNLEVLDVFSNSLRGTIPFELYMLPLIELDFETNAFTGIPFPSNADVFSAKTTLESLRLSQNSFTEYVLPSYLNEFPSLVRLWIADSNAKGTIPSEINNLSNLRSFIASENNLSGSIPEMTASLKNLRNLQLDMNQLNSTIPASLGDATNLRILNFSDNFLTGTLPLPLSNLVNLTNLELSNNTLKGTVPPEFSNLSGLVNITLDRNNFSGQIPNFGLCEQIELIRLSNNTFNGTIPSDLFELTNLKFIYLNDNNFTGHIPENYGNPESLIDLYLNDNELTGTIPDIEPGDWVSITEVLFNGNNLSDPVPDSICKLDWEYKKLFADCDRNNCTCCTTCVREPTALPSTIESPRFSTAAPTSSSSTTIDFWSYIFISLMASFTLRQLF